MERCGVGSSGDGEDDDYDFPSVQLFETPQVKQQQEARRFVLVSCTDVDEHAVGSRYDSGRVCGTVAAINRTDERETSEIVVRVAEEGAGPSALCARGATSTCESGGLGSPWSGYVMGTRNPARYAVGQQFDNGNVHGHVCAIDFEQKLVVVRCS
jgi:hypothetical protein